MEWSKDEQITQHCYYCNGQRLAEKKAYFEYEMYYVSKRTIFPVGINYHSTKVPVPRCSKCKQIHNRNFYILTLFWISAIAVSALSFHHFSDMNLLTIGILSVIISSLFCWIANVIYNDYLFQSIFKIKPENTVEDYLVVFEMLNEGWTESKPDPADARTAEQNKEERRRS